ncbi:MAG: ECF transporter S component [Oscillospiraceae bacterium]|nr:ECF transporter S component [Oscillospiraceae bacterium]
MKNKQLVNLILTALLSALAFVLFLLEFSVMPAAPHLKMDFSDVPALLAGAVLGPIYGVLVELIKNLIELITKGFGTQMGFGNLMNFLVGCGYVLPFSIIYRVGRKQSGGNSLSAGSSAMRIVFAAMLAIPCIAAIGIAGNYFITPLFFQYFLNISLKHRELWANIWYATIVNLIKGATLTVVAFPGIIGFEAAVKRALQGRS